MISEAILNTLEAAALQDGAEPAPTYLGILLKSIFVENILLAFFLGMCSYLAGKRVDSALGLGIAAVIFVLGLTVPLNWLIDFLLDPGALAWPAYRTRTRYLQFLTFIATIAAAVQLVEMAVDKFSPKLYSRSASSCR